MNRQAQIDACPLAAHRLALARLRDDPSRVEAARNLLARWRRAKGPSRSDPCWDEWDHLLAAGPGALEAAACGDGDRAAVLRSVSPLGVITQRERASLPAEARQQ